MKNKKYSEWMGKKVQATEEYINKEPPTPEIANQIGIVVGYHTGQSANIPTYKGPLCTIWPPCKKRKRNDYLLSKLRGLDLEEIDLTLVPGGHFLCIWAYMHEIVAI